MRVAVGFVNLKCFQDSVPACGGGGLEEDEEASVDRFEVEHVVNAIGVLDVHEEGHAEDGVDEHDEEEEKADVEESWHGHCQRKQQGPDSFGTLH